MFFCDCSAPFTAFFRDAQLNAMRCPTRCAQLGISFCCVVRHVFLGGDALFLSDCFVTLQYRFCEE